jgi:hypothetical protein
MVRLNPLLRARGEEAPFEAAVLRERRTVVQLVGSVKNGCRTEGNREGTKVSGLGVQTQVLSVRSAWRMRQAQGPRAR